MESIKQQVLNFIKINGPILPADVAKEVGKNLILAGALLSDLLSDKLIKISKAKIGGSPVYYFAGQEAKLTKLYDYLPGKEKEAYNLLREKKLVKDKEIPAGIRVALRNMRDFAIPVEHNNELYWGWYLASQNEIEQLLPKILEPIKKVEEKIEVKAPEIKQVEEKKVKVVKKVLKKSEFFDNVKNYLSANKIEIVREELNKRTEVSFVGAVNSDIGKLNFLIVARGKKRINDSDLTLAYSQGHKLKMPVIFISPGSLTKKAEKYLEENKGYVVFKSMNS